MTRRTVVASAAAPFLNLRAQNRADRPNILWVIGDDLGPLLNCYGHRVVRTPNIDRISQEGVRFTHAYTTAPVCSSSRSAFNTGVYQTTTGTHNHRSHRTDGYRLPDGVRLITECMREAGYFTANVLEIGPGVRGSGKTDFNFRAEKPFDGTHWNQRRSGQPFYAQVNFQAPHKGPAFVEARKQARLTDPAAVELPPYYPDHPVVRDEVANYYDAINLLDSKVGVLMEALKRDGVLDNTLIVFFGDNGRCLLRGKQWLYDPGTHIPLLVRWPGQVKAGGVRDDLVSAVDITATSIDAARAPRPRVTQGQTLLGSRRREYLVTARDRCDMTVDRIRAVRDGRYKYIRNFMPDRPYTQYNEYIQKSYPTLSVLQELDKAGKLNSVQRQFLAARRPEVEFYDTHSDPHEVNNLAASPDQQERVVKFGSVLERWIEESGDQGRTPEPRAAIEAEEPRAR